MRYRGSAYSPEIVRRDDLVERPVRILTNIVLKNVDAEEFCFRPSLVIKIVLNNVIQLYA